MPRFDAAMVCLALLSTLAVPGLALDGGPIMAMPPSVAPTVGAPLRHAAMGAMDRLPETIPESRSATIDFDTPVETDYAEPAGRPIIDPPRYWTWQVMPDGLLYRPYLAGVREPRLGIQLYHEKDEGGLWDGSIGGRIGLLRYGSDDPLWPEGWQFDVEAGAFPRLTADDYGDLISADFRYGCALTQRQGRLETKFAFYHLSSHLGDEYYNTHPWRPRINFSRFALVLGGAVYPWDNVRVYGEVGYSFYCDGGTEPWELQFGIDYSPLNPSGLWGAPFFAVNGHLREEVDFGGNFVLETGWQWRGNTGRLARCGFYYFNGQSNQYQFYWLHEQHVGIGFWYDY